MIPVQINSWASHPSSLTSLPRSLLKVWLGYCVNLRGACFESQSVLQQPRCGSARFYHKTHPPYYHQSCYTVSGVQYFSVMFLVVLNCHGFCKTDRIRSFKHPFVCQKTSCVTKNNLVYFLSQCLFHLECMKKGCMILEKLKWWFFFLSFFGNFITLLKQLYLERMNGSRRIGKDLLCSGQETKKEKFVFTLKTFLNWVLMSFSNINKTFMVLTIHLHEKKKKHFENRFQVFENTTVIIM